MRAKIRMLLLASLTTVAMAPVQGHALLNSQCGDYYAGNRTCSFTAVGPNVSVFGSTNVSGIVVRVTDPTGNVRIVECTGQFSCYSTFGIAATGTDSVGPPAGVGPLTCTVLTSGSGYFRCQSTI